MLPLTPITLAFAQELAVRAQARPDITLLEALENILRDRPTLDAKGFEPVCAQINDLVDITTPPHDRARMVLLIALPGHRGVLFTASELMLSDAILLPHSPVAAMAAKLAAAMDPKWESFRKAAEACPVPTPHRTLLAPSGLPAERIAASGPTPGNIQDFLPGGSR